MKLARIIGIELVYAMALISGTVALLIALKIIKPRDMGQCIEWMPRGSMYKASEPECVKWGLK